MKTSRLMRKMAVMLSAILLLAFLSWGQQQSAPPAPDWSKRAFSAPPGEVFAFAAIVLQSLTSPLRNHLQQQLFPQEGFIIRRPARAGESSCEPYCGCQLCSFCA
jgi:hypothetical protein